MTVSACVLLLGVLLRVPQAAINAPTASASPAAPTASAAHQEQTVYLLGKLLRCPVCQGMPVGESPSPMARDMMQLIREKVAAGESQDAIQAYFVQRYGEWVLLAPQAQGFNWLVYLLPPLALGLCGLWTVSYLGRPGRSDSAEAVAAADLQTGDAPGTQGLPDPYLEQIQRELRK